MSKYNETLKKYKENFVRQRTMQEVAFSEAVQSMKELTEEQRTLLGINDPDEFLYQNMFPSLYSEEYDEEAYKKEYEAATQKILAYNNKVDVLEEEAHKLLISYENNFK